MKRLQIPLLPAVVVLVAGLVLAAPAPAAETRTVVPATSAAILQAVDAQSAALQKLVRDGALADVHHVAFAIRDLVAALPAKSASLPPEKLAAVKGDAKFVATLAGRLDERGDANDRAGAQAEYAKLQKVLAHLHAVYSK